MENKVLENRYRRWARRLGLVLHKSRARSFQVNNRGGYMLREASSNLILAGERFELSIEQVSGFLAEYEAKASMPVTE